MKIKEIISESEELDEGLWDGIGGALSGVKKGGFKNVIANAKAGYQSGEQQAAAEKSLAWMGNEAVKKWNEYVVRLAKEGEDIKKDDALFQTKLKEWLGNFVKSPLPDSENPASLAPADVKSFITKHVSVALRKREQQRVSGTKDTDQSDPQSASSPTRAPAKTTLPSSQWELEPMDREIKADWSPKDRILTVKGGDQARSAQYRKTAKGWKDMHTSEMIPLAYSAELTSLYNQASGAAPEIPPTVAPPPVKATGPKVKATPRAPWTQAEIDRTTGSKANKTYVRPTSSTPGTSEKQLPPGMQPNPSRAGNPSQRTNTQLAKAAGYPSVAAYWAALHSQAASGNKEDEQKARQIIQQMGKNKAADRAAHKAAQAAGK